MKMNLQLDPTMPKGGSYRRHRKDHFMANSAPAVPTAPVEIAMEGEIISKSEPGNASSIPDKVANRTSFTEQQVCRSILVSLCKEPRKQSSLNSFVRTTKKVSFTGDEIRRCLSVTLKNVKDLDFSDSHRFCSVVAQRLIDKQYLIPDNYKNASLTEDTIYNINAEELLVGLQEKDNGLTATLSLQLLLSFLASDKKDRYPSPNTSVMASQSEPVLPISGEEEISVNSRGSLEDLVSYLTTENHSDINFRDDFVLTHPTFTTPEELVSHLISRWNIEPTEEENSSETQLTIFKKEKRATIRIKIVSFLKIWVENFPTVFKENTPFWNTLQPLYDLAKNDVAENVFTRFSDAITNSMTNYNRKKELLDRILNFTVPDNLDIGDWILSYNVDDIAQQITVLDHMIFSNISVSELLNKNWTRPNKKELSPNICILTSRFNNAAHWVASIIVQCISTEKRIQLLGRLIEISHALKDLGNHYGAMALYAGLTNSAVKRLGRTWDKLDEQDSLLFDSLREQYHSDDNYGVYRATIKKSQNTCTPYIGLFLRDLIYVEEHPNNIDGFINFKKRSAIGSILKDIKRYQTRQYNIQLNEAILPVIANYPHINDADAYQLSLLIEPRNPYSVIENLLTEEEQLKNKLEELKKKLLKAKQDYKKEQDRNTQLRSTTGDSGWKRFASPVSSPQRKAFLSKRT